jgi:hypothetical protein
MNEYSEHASTLREKEINQKLSLLIFSDLPQRAYATYTIRKENAVSVIRISSFQESGHSEKSDEFLLHTSKAELIPVRKVPIIPVVSTFRGPSVIHQTLTMVWHSSGMGDTKVASPLGSVHCSCDGHELCITARDKFLHSTQQGLGAGLGGNLQSKGQCYGLGVSPKVSIPKLGLRWQC